MGEHRFAYPVVTELRRVIAAPEGGHPGDRLVGPALPGRLAPATPRSAPPARAAATAAKR